LTSSQVAVTESKSNRSHIKAQLKSNGSQTTVVTTALLQSGFQVRYRNVEPLRISSPTPQRPLSCLSGSARADTAVPHPCSCGVQGPYETFRHNPTKHSAITFICRFMLLSIQIRLLSINHPFTALSK